MVTDINREELRQKLDHPKKSVLLEALAPEDYRHAHLPGALNMPSDQVRTLAHELIPRPDMEVIVYCAGPECHSSEKVAQLLLTMGYSNVRLYKGGKRDWIEAGLPMVEGDQRAA
ncbi:MAG: rhodanese-like domain-containing protein [Acidobacteria bacterium]|nr:rhodanese-like domain-containing protein [Acidobacteriota bacterium]